MDSVEVAAALTLMGEQKRLLKTMEEKKEEGSSVCKAIDDLIEDGKKEGAERINDLNRRLLKDNRQEDLLKAVEDLAYQKKLLQEYGLA